MRQVVRHELSARSTRMLEREQTKADRKHAEGALRVEAEWKRARQNKPLQEAVDVLRLMAGNRERCMYCGDSHGTDIEHFWPKAHFPERMFRWLNMLLCCTECGRIKGETFPLVDGVPMLIDPSTDNPWEFLDFDPLTGNIVARYSPASQQYLPKGEQTVAVLRLDRREAMARGYQRTYRRIKQVIEQALEQTQVDAGRFFDELNEADDHGLLGWCFNGTGRRVSPFTDLQHRHPTVWAACEHAYHEP